MKFGGHVRTALLMLADLVCFFGVWVAVVYIYRAVGIGHYRPSFYLRLWPSGFLFALVNMLFRLYGGGVFYPSVSYAPVEEMRRLVESSVVTHLLLIAYLVLAYQTTEHYSRFVICVSGFGVAFLAQPFRNAVRTMMFGWGIGRIPVILAGTGRTAQQLSSAISADRHVGLEVVRSVGDDFRSLVRVGRETGVRTLVACQDSRLLRAQLSELFSWYRYVESVPSAEIFPAFGARVISVDGMGGVEMVNRSRMGLVNAEKWVLDKLLAVWAAVVLSPLFVVIPALVKLTSPGPVFYRQERLGKGGRPIRVWKFRSMYVDADERLKNLLAHDPAAAAEWKDRMKLRNDPRVTPFGRFLRRTSLDELPQLFNVFLGDMAIVGPRPIVRSEVAYYGASYGCFSSVLPGITGLWQVSGRSDTDYARRVALDVQYVLNWSPWMDLWIVRRTVGAVLFMRGAR